MCHLYTILIILAIVVGIIFIPYYLGKFGKYCNDKSKSIPLYDYNLSCWWAGFLLLTVYFIVLPLVLILIIGAIYLSYTSVLNFIQSMFNC